MTIDASAPDRAAKRTDLPFLRHRSRMAQPSRPAHSAMAEFVAGQATAHAHPTARSASTSLDRDVPSVSSLDLGSSLDLSAPQPVPTQPVPTPPVPTPRQAATVSRSEGSADTSLDLSAPQPPPAVRRAASAASADTSLDLSAPAQPTAPRRAPTAAHRSIGTSLDLGAVPMASTTPVPAAPGRSTSLDLPRVPPTLSPAAPPIGARKPNAAAAGRIPAWPEPRTTQGVPTILNVRSPTVTLTRVQSGVGTLTFEAVAATGVGDLRLGSAYQLRSGRSSTVQHQAGRRFAPPGETRRPLLLAARGQFERISLDLRQVTDLERCVVYGFSGDGSELRWGGTLVVTTFGGDRIEMPMEMAPSTAVAVLGSVYNIGGQLVLRSEMDLIGRTIREACRGYGFDRITWLDDVTPAD